MRFIRHLCLFALIFTLSGCDQVDQERNIIVGRQPFFIAKLPYREGSESAIISIVKAFALENKMDYLGGPGHPTLEQGQFNLTVAGEMLNLGVTRVVTTLPNMEIYAIARGDPTLKDKDLAAELVRRLNQAPQFYGVQSERRPAALRDPDANR